MTFALFVPNLIVICMSLMSSDLHIPDFVPVRDTAVDHDSSTSIILDDAEREVELALFEFGRVGVVLSNSRCKSAKRVNDAIIALREVAPSSNPMLIDLARNDTGPKVSKILTRCYTIGRPR